MRRGDPLQNLLYKSGQHQELTGAEDDLFTPELKKKYLDPFDEERPDPENFNDVYPQEMIEQNMEAVKRRKTEFATKATERSLLAERLLYFLINKKELLGRGTEALASSEYDDYFNGTDLVLEFKRGAENLWLAVDVTASQDPSVLQYKKEKIEKELEKGRLTRLRYFQSEPKHKGKVDMPKINLVIPPEELASIAKLFSSKQFNDLTLRKLQEKFTKKIREEIERQIEWLNSHLLGAARYAVSAPKNARELIAAYEAVYQNLSQ